MFTCRKLYFHIGSFSARQGKRLEHFTIGWNTLEGLVAVVAGALAGSISLVGFGIDSFIEVISGATLLWRTSVDNEAQRERNERTALRIVGVCFVILSLYIAYESIADLLARRTPEHSIPGIVLAIVSLVVMPLLSRAKRRVGTFLASAGMHADAKQTEFCTYLSAILLGGLVLNAAFVVCRPYCRSCYGTYHLARGNRRSPSEGRAMPAASIPERETHGEGKGIGVCSLAG
jgi:divalent metal cation (Fe/Co/Zn/Cd) transporter